MNIDQLHKEITYKAVASSGPGGQHANKTATKVTLEWYVNKSKAFTTDQLQRIQRILHKRLTRDGVLQLSCQQSRSQSSNKQLVFDRFITLITQALTEQKIRKKQTLPRAVKRKRLNEKKKHSEKKKNRNFKYKP